MKIAQEKLLFDTFIAFNKTRFADVPEMLALFEGATSDNLTIDLIEYLEDGPTVTINGPGFTAPETTYLKANITKTVNGWMPSNIGGPIGSVQELFQQDTSGVYEVDFYDTEKVVVLLTSSLVDEKGGVNAAANSVVEDCHLYSLVDGRYEDDGSYLEFEESGDGVSLYGRLRVFFKDDSVELSGEEMGLIEIPLS